MTRQTVILECSKFADKDKAVQAAVNMTAKMLMADILNIFTNITKIRDPRKLLTMQSDFATQFRSVYEQWTEEKMGEFK